MDRGKIIYLMYMKNFIILLLLSISVFAEDAKVDHYRLTAQEQYELEQIDVDNVNIFISSGYAIGFTDETEWSDLGDQIEECE